MPDMTKVVNTVERCLGIFINRKDYLWVALQGAVNGSDPEHKNGSQQLARLGDRIIDILILERRINPSKYGIFMDDAWYQYAVSNAVFADILTETGVAKLFEYSNNTQGNDRYSHNLGTIFELIVAVLYLDQGLDAVRIFLDRILFPNVKRLLIKYIREKPMMCLVHYCQCFFGVRPIFRVIKGSEEENYYAVEVIIPHEVKYVGKGPSVFAAKNDAALKAISAFGPVI